MLKIRILLAAMLMMFAASAHAALNAYAALTVNGTALDGDTTMTEIGGVDVSSDHIEIYQIDHSMLHAGKNRTESGPFVLMKRIDQTSPILLSALADGFRVDGDIKIFDTDLQSGQTRHRFTIRITQGRVVGIETKLPDAFDASESNRPPVEYIQIELQSYWLVDEVHATESEITF